MKRFLFIGLFILMLSTVACYSAIVTLEWDYSAEAQAMLGATGGFKIYQSKTSGNYTAIPVATAGPSARSISFTTKAGTYFWTATAFDDEGNESDKSNEVTGTAKTGKPLNLRVTIAN